MRKKQLSVKHFQFSQDFYLKKKIKSKCQSCVSLCVCYMPFIVPFIPTESTLFLVYFRDAAHNVYYLRLFSIPPSLSFNLWRSGVEVFSADKTVPHILTNLVRPLKYKRFRANLRSRQRAGS